MKDLQFEYGNRPKLKIPLTKTEYVLDGVSVAMLLAMLIVVGMKWDVRPGTVPLPMGLDGKAIGRGANSFLLGSLAVNITIFVLLTVLRGYPEIFNYPRAITPENAPYQYRNARLMLGWIKAEIVLAFFLGTGEAWASKQSLSLFGLSAYGLSSIVFFTLLYFLGRSLRENPRG